MRLRATWAASISTALVSATLVGIGGAASAVAPPPELQQRSTTVTFKNCDVRTTRNDPNTRVGAKFDWTTTLELELESPVSSEDLDHRVTVRAGTPLPLPTSLSSVDAIHLGIGFNL